MSNLATTRPQSTARSEPTAVLRGRAPRTALPARIAMRVGMTLLIWGTRPASRSGAHVGYGDPDPPRPPDAAELRALATQGWQHPPFVG